MSTLDVETGGRSAPGMDGFGVYSFLTGAALTVVSFDVDLCGMFLISLYLDCLGVWVSDGMHIQGWIERTSEGQL